MSRTRWNDPPQGARIAIKKMDHETLQGRTENYLSSLIREAADTALVFDPETPFGELGVNSFLVLKILKRLEQDFGVLPKTLLFENFNVRDLARYFVRAHRDVLLGKFGGNVESRVTTSTSNPTPVARETAASKSPAPAAVPSPQPVAMTRPATPSVAVPPTSAKADAGRVPSLISIHRLDRHPELRTLRDEIFHRYKNESSVSRGTNTIAPLLFFGRSRRGFFNCAKARGILLAYGYTGPEDAFLPLAEELFKFCERNGLQFNLFAEQSLPPLGGKTFSATPFGVMQRVTDLPSFTLDGQKMKRLRYLVSKFTGLGVCSTTEHVSGTDRATAEAIATVIDQWCAGRTMVNPLIHRVRQEILDGTLDREHRVFVTTLDGVVQNAILVSPMVGVGAAEGQGSGAGYLMDLEFYGPDMPLGGLEYAITQIIRQLRGEGCQVFSLGGTYGCKLGDSPSADPAVEKLLDELREQGIFNDAGNLQFKNKFRPESKDIFLCRATDAGQPENVLDIILMIAEPSATQDVEEIEEVDTPTQLTTAGDRSTATLDPEFASGGPRWDALVASGFNPLNLAAPQVEFDFRTDSWAQLEMPVIDKRMAGLIARIHAPVDLQSSLRKLFPFSHFTLAASGRDAEDLFCRAWSTKGRVPQNLLFPSTILHQIDKGFSPVELPVATVFDLGGDDAWRGHLDLQALQAELDTHRGNIGYVCIELADNAAGGGMVSPAHLEQVKALLAPYGVALVLDATRVLENALYLTGHDPAWRDASLWQTATALLSHADAVVASLGKDFCVNKGGLIATNDTALHERLQTLQQGGGRALDAIDRKCIALSLDAPAFIETSVRRRVDTVRSLWSRLNDAGVPVVRPANGHCVLIDVKRIPAFSGLAAPLPSFLAWLYHATGARAGAHSVGMQKDSPLNGLVRLAIPVGSGADDIRAFGDRLVAAFADIHDIPDLRMADGAGERPGDLHARFLCTRLLRPASVGATGDNGMAPFVSVPNDTGQTDGAIAVPAAPAVGRSANVRTASPDDADMEIAIVGMAARFPKARNAEELWDNLASGRDCITELPDSRYARRRNRDALGRYRGGFIDDSDRFDSLFFNISPREAETLDPQERLFLEASWEALEDAGYYPESFQSDEQGARRIGVYVGAVWTTYQIVGAEERLAGNMAIANSFLWSIANRVSYFMNFIGPSMAVDTACSASLTAIHLACEAIRRGECAAAIVGGVNLDVHQCKQEITVAGGLLSDEGLCRAFGRGASGYVPGEGVGALLLKPLHKALEDRDNIYAVVKGSAISHGGRNSGYAVPNSRAQCEAITSALDRAGVDARSIGYIEAHGTGTELGDPIEIAGLNQAFERDQVPLHSVAIGSIKTNIGHLEAAAGIAGVCKTLLQMRHRTLAPSLHSAELNEFIDFAHSPFVVQQQLAPWEPKRVDGVLQPLRAGISSFGAGGSNAHVILESVASIGPASAGDVVARDSGTAPRIFPLSARNEEQLRQTATRLKAFIEKHRDASTLPSLDDIAFTLQVGRKSFDHRVAIIADGVAALLDRLQRFIDDGRGEDILVGHVRNAEGITRLLNRQEKQAFVDLLAQSRDPHKIAQLWIDGVVSDWQGMVSATAGRRVSLPTYPFADKRHWLEPAAGVGLLPQSGFGGSPGLHPLIDTNESTFERQVFRKVFNDREFFIYDHLVSGIPTLPGVAYLDFARKAGEIAAGRKVRRIRNILWVSPLTVQNGVPNEVFIELKPAGDAVQFEVFSERTDAPKQLYCQGKLYYAGPEDSDGDEYIDLDAIRSRCEKVVDGAQAYPLFKQLGLDLGPTFQALREVHRNPAESFEVLGALRIPEGDALRFDEFVLHPSLVDSSFQAAMGARLAGTSGEMYVPYSLGEVEILHPLTPVCYSYVTEAKDERKTASNLSKMNVLIVDETGRVLVRVRESVGVPLLDVHEKKGEGAFAKVPAGGDAAFPTLYYGTEWQSAAFPSGTPVPAVRGTLVCFALDEANAEALRAAFAAHAIPDPVLVLPGATRERIDTHTWRIDPAVREDFDHLLATLHESRPGPLSICFAWPSAPSAEVYTQSVDAQPVEARIGHALDLGVHAFLSLVQAIIARKSEADTRLQYVYFGAPGTAQPHNDAIQGFATILRAESPKLACKVIEFVQPQPVFGPDVAEALCREFEDGTKALAIRHHDGRRFVRRIEACPNPGTRGLETAPIRQRGAYIITGGAGGLGLIFAEYLASRHQARLVLSGRSAPSEAMEAAFEAMRNAGAEVRYVQADVSRREDVERLVGTCRDTYGAVHGILHSAGVLRDAYIRNKTREEMTAVFAPKILGTVLLDDLTRDDALDFFVTFSSLAALAGNAGQCDYSFANHFMDAFAAQRNARTLRGERQGRALSLNWSIWAEGGMRLDEQTALFFERNLGIKPLQREVGIEAFLLGLQSEMSQLAVLQGVKEKVERAWGIGAPTTAEADDNAQASTTTRTADAARDPASQGAAAATAAAPTAAGDDGALVLAVQASLSQIVMDFLKIDAADIDLDTILLDLGFDSIGLTSFSNLVNTKYGLDITPVAFFEYPNIREISRHLAHDHRDNILRVHGQAGASTATPASSSPATTAPGTTTTTSATPIAFKQKPAVATAQIDAPSIGGGFSPQRRFIERPIAIVGMSGVMPQADDIEEYWEKLRNAENNMVTLVPPDRWDWEAYYGNPMEEKNKTLSKWGGFMREVDKFDPLFWGISPREAEMMDPQQRIFLESVWGAIEDSGHKVSDFSGTRTGLFVGAATRDYIDMMAMNHAELDGYSASGTSHAILVNRVSFLLDLHGPSAPLDTACSSSLIALHRAIESIHTGSCDMAIVGGVQVMLTPAGHISFGAAGMLADDGKCKTFDSRANGYVRGEGSGAILIRPLEDAIADGDHIYAVVKATAENHGGKATMLTAPNPNAQADLLVEAYEKAEIDPRSVGYLECHGTGTSLGDPIEIQAMKKAFMDLYRKHQLPPPTTPHIGLTSAKTNIGHLETAAGIAGLLKVLLSIKHRQIPALLHFEKLNPYINLDNSPFYPVDKTRDWLPALDDQGKPYPLRAGISSFGFGGANVHAVLEEYPVDVDTARARPSGPYLFVLSAKTSDRLKANTARLIAHLNRHPDEDLADLAYTLQVGRDAMPERLGLVADSHAALVERLQAFVDGDAEGAGVRLGSVRRKSDIRATEEATLAEWLGAKNLDALLDVWLKGQEPAWKALYAGFRMRRLSLPTYAFARERYWFGVDQEKLKAQAGGLAMLHPLLHRNVSVFGRQSFESGIEPLRKALKEAKLQVEGGWPELLPLEMARLAVGESLGDRRGDARIVLDDLRWYDAAAGGEGRLVVDLFATGTTSFDLELNAATASGEGLLCSGAGRHERTGAPSRIDPVHLRSLFVKDAIAVRGDNDTSATLFWATAVRDCRLADDQCLVEFAWPDPHNDRSDALVPLRLLSLAHRAGLELLAGQGITATDTALLSLEHAEFMPVIDASAGSIWVRTARGERENGVARLDVDVLDDEGRVLIRLRGLAIGYPEEIDIARGQADEFAALLESVYADSGNAPAGVGQDFAGVLDVIYEAGTS